METMVKRVPRALIRQEVADRMTEGWHIVKQNEDEIVMQKYGNCGSVKGHAFTFLLTAGIGNLIYGTHSKIKNMKELHIRVEATAQDLEQIEKMHNTVDCKPPS